ncbi:MAG: RNA ligase, partial [Clostridia bacterium]
INFKHPAYLSDYSFIRYFQFSKLLKGIEEEVKNGYINVQSHPEFPYLKIYKYSQDAVMKKRWNIYTIISRGLILDTKHKKVLATPFPKFWNYNELFLSKEVETDNVVISEKKDGSLGIGFKFLNKWMVATCGSFMSEQARWAQKFFDKNIEKSELDNNTTYLFEIIYPENRIVIPYSSQELCLLSAYKKGKEIAGYYLDELAKISGFTRPKTYTFFSIQEALDVSDSLKYDEEGFVVRFSNGIRIKIKGKEYLRIHKIMSRITPLGIWELMLNGDNLDMIKKELPEELQKDFNNIFSILENKMKIMLESLLSLHKKTSHLSNKELGLELSNNNSILCEGINDKSMVKFLFEYRKVGFLNNLNNKKSLLRMRFFTMFRPKNNILEGYVPSSNFNRFLEETE